MNVTNSSTPQGMCIWNNKTEQDLPEASKTAYVFIVGFPPLLLLCTVGNCMNMLILSRAKPLQNTDVYLLATACADLGAL